MFLSFFFLTPFLSFLFPSFYLNSYRILVDRKLFLYISHNFSNTTAIFNKEFTISATENIYLYLKIYISLQTLLHVRQVQLLHKNVLSGLNDIICLSFSFYCFGNFRSPFNLYLLTKHSQFSNTRRIFSRGKKLFRLTKGIQNLVTFMNLLETYTVLATFLHFPICNFYVLNIHLRTIVSGVPVILFQKLL
jgi:hypothetical protein